MGKWPQSLESNGPFFKSMSHWTNKMGWTRRQYCTEDIIFSTVSVCIYLTTELYKNTVLTLVYHPSFNFNSTLDIIKSVIFELLH